MTRSNQVQKKKNGLNRGEILYQSKSCKAAEEKEDENNNNITKIHNI